MYQGLTDTDCRVASMKHSERLRNAERRQTASRKVVRPDREEPTGAGLLFRLTKIFAGGLRAIKPQPVG
jgi:hypothetical protein